MRKLVSGVAIAALLAPAVLAQDAAVAQDAQVTSTVQAAPEPMAAEAAPAVMADIVLRAGTPITLAVSEEVNSSTHREGDIFKLLVLNDVTLGNKIVIPKGTPAFGEITWRTGKGAFGKSGKIEFLLSHIELGGQKIPLLGEFRQEGEGNTVATGVGVIAIGVFAGFITGKRARLPVGRELMGRTGPDVTFTADGALSASYNGAAAMATAASATPLGQCKAAAAAISNEKKRKSALEDCYKERMD